MSKSKVALQPSDQHPATLVHFHEEGYYEDHPNVRETRFPTGEARLNQSSETLVCRNDAAHSIGNGAYYTVELEEPVCFQCRPFKVGPPTHIAGRQ